MEDSSETSQRLEDVDGPGDTEQQEEAPTQSSQADFESHLRMEQPQAGSLLDLAAQDENRNGRHDVPIGNSTIGDPAKISIGFGSLSKEMRELVWESAWCTRLVRSDLPPCLHRQMHDPGVLCDACFRRLTRVPARDPSVAFVSHEARDCAWKRAKALALTLWTWTLIQGRTYYNPGTDILWLCSATLLRAVQVYGPMNRDEVLIEAMEPEAAVMIDMDLIFQCDTYETEYAVLNLLYHWYLKSHSHVHLNMHTFELDLGDEAWQQALEWDLFREYEGQSRLVALDDIDTLRKCLALRWASTMDLHAPAAPLAIRLLVEDDLRALGRKYVTLRVMRIHTLMWSLRWPQTWRASDRLGLSDVQVFRLRLADVLMEVYGGAGPNSGRGEVIMGLDGRLREGHPVVEGFDISLPEFKPVVVFEVAARRRP
ncbi:hypothetical protein VMCG_10253 [Cytospora schulzeri]|uniref:2EXR domain-containing protein n=1 Tax=Cytospora schulzeri TaxID=448051 RepID=A0A423VGT3_9PEZI|nr:hypothetical protein VMCG_10253 [Valsa malicola]